MEGKNSETEDPVKKEVEHAIDKAYSEHFDTYHQSKTVGLVGDIAYAEELAIEEDDIRMVNPESEPRKRYAENMTERKIAKDMEKFAAEKVNQDECGQYPNANRHLVEKGINPVVDSFASEKKLSQLIDMQEAERKRREYREQEAKRKEQGN